MLGLFRSCYSHSDYDDRAGRCAFCWNTKGGSQYFTFRIVPNFVKPKIDSPTRIDSKVIIHVQFSQAADQVG